MTYRNRSLYMVFNIISQKCKEGNIIKCIEDDAKIMYKNINECKHLEGTNKGKYIIIRGRNRKSLIAACVFFACRRKGKTRSPKEIAKIFDLKYTDITKGCKKFLELMKLRKMDITLHTNLPEDYVPRYCRVLKIKGDYVDLATKIARNTRLLNIATKHTPVSIATASILLMIEMNDLTVTKKSIASKFEVSEVTIGKAYKCIAKDKNIIIDDEKTKKILGMLEEEKKKLVRPSSLEKRYMTVVMNRKKRDDGSDTIHSAITETENEFSESSMENAEYDNIYDIEFDINNDNLEEYILDISAELYDVGLKNEKIYKKITDYHNNFLKQQEKSHTHTRQSKSAGL